METTIHLNPDLKRIVSAMLIISVEIRCINIFIDMIRIYDNYAYIPYNKMILLVYLKGLSVHNIRLNSHSE